jgi:hypothetical protein
MTPPRTPSAEEIAHLWEADHPYYMTEGNYYENGCHTTYPTLDAFLDDWSKADRDLNWIVRWDWLEGEDWGAGEYRGDDYYRNGRLLIQMIGQRKARLWSLEVAVCRADEARVLEYLRPFASLMAETWAPLITPDILAQPEREEPRDG